MSIYRRAAKRDKNEPEIIQALRAVGASVAQNSAPGLPDLLVGYRGQTYLIEVKAPKGTLTPDQVEFMRQWEGTLVHICKTPDEALRAIGAID